MNRSAFAVIAMVALVVHSIDARAIDVHWAYVPPQRPALPVVQHGEQVRNPIDRFVLAKLEGAGLGFAPRAELRQLARRVHFDLTGLPPTTEQLRALAEDPSPDAWERFVDALLDSPAYGEHVALHWLDLARFAETDGFEHDLYRKNAWRYRDWVIAAMNENLPYDRFVRSQLAGDELSDGHDSLGTGFLLAGQDMPDINSQPERRHNVLNEMTATVGEVFLAMTFGCAQCHDHKSDPISQADFYRLRAFFENTVDVKRDEQLGHVIDEAGRVPPHAFVMLRGDYRSPGAAVEPRFPQAIARDATQPTIDAGASVTSSMRRAALARWMTDDGDGAGLFAARVMVNRLWQQMMDRPLVETPSDFGHMGAVPTHAALLDWLACEFVRTGWDVKRMIRLIATSRTYQQSSLGSGADWSQRLAADPHNELLSRMHRKRLTGEAIRDAMLVAAGTLDRRAGGPGVRPPLPPEVTATLLNKQWEVSEDVSQHVRRSVYIMVRRNLRYPIFEVFDRPEGHASCPRRQVSTTARQSLTLFNGPLSQEVASRIAETIQAETSDLSHQVAAVFHVLLQRPPTESELADAFQWLQSPPREYALADLCVALINSNEFVYLD